MWILKEAVSVISSDPLCNDDNVWFTTVPLTALFDDLIKHELDIQVQFFFHLRCLCKCDLLIWSNWNFIRIKTLFESAKRHLWSDFGLKGTFENRAFPSLHEVSLENTLTVPIRVPLIKKVYLWLISLCKKVERMFSYMQCTIYCRKSAWKVQSNKLADVTKNVDITQNINPFSFPVLFFKLRNFKGPLIHTL